MNDFLKQFEKSPEEKAAYQKRVNSPFRMPIEEVFVIRGRPKVVVTGRVQTGILRKGSQVFITADNVEPIVTTVTWVDMPFIRDPDSFVAYPDDNIGIQFLEIEPEQVRSGMIVTTQLPGDEK